VTVNPRLKSSCLSIHEKLSCPRRQLFLGPSNQHDLSRPPVQTANQPAMLSEAHCPKSARTMDERSGNVSLSNRSSAFSTPNLRNTLVSHLRTDNSSSDYGGTAPIRRVSIPVRPFFCSLLLCPLSLCKTLALDSALCLSKQKAGQDGSLPAFLIPGRSANGYASFLFTTMLYSLLPAAPREKIRKEASSPVVSPRTTMLPLLA